MRLISQSSTFQKIIPELERQLNHSAALSGWRGTIQVTTDLGTDSLGIAQGRISHTIAQTKGYRLEIPQDKLTQLMMGRRAIEDLAVDTDVTVDEEIIPVLDTLFPVSYGHV